ncbi:Aim9 protein [Saccharomycopsis crataegensis]|uniref:Altered inheritance of mitochondria protein 9, mitochondrial n=1 Tax=Saccharomycopsis crataegensis TaxID=43959 RepID=A0AAV5QFW1_9ASCO|nr:Aim9 protein [Saccharomycopsis crataegensis]
MLRNSIARNVTSRLLSRNGQTLSKNVATGLKFTPVRYNSTLKSEDQVKPVFTRLSDENDPERNLFFKYTWGTWLKNDKQEKEKRFTSFSIEGLNKVVQGLFQAEPVADGTLPKPLKNSDNTVSFTQNIKDLVGDVKEADKLFVKTMSSIHEGKHNRVYKIELSNGKALVLRVPYKLLTEYATSRQIQSEAATLDFARYKLGVRVPKVLSYGMHSLNPVRTPYILMEYVEGDLLMKQWDPAVETSDPSHRDTLNKVIKPLSNFQKKLLSVEFNQFGSLYFTDDVSPQLQLKGEPYAGETDDNLKGRWRMGLSMDRNLWRNKEQLQPSQFNPLLGPIDKSQPEKIIQDAANMEIENLRSRLGLTDADASNKVEDPELLKREIKVYEKLAHIAPFLIDDKSNAIPKVEELFKPRLAHPDIDPMNVISSKNGELVFLDFENVTVKPFIYTKSPDFVNYDGYKIYDLADIPDFEKLSDQEKYEYSLMQKRSRNQHLWEFALNENNRELISSVSPYIKELKSPYTVSLLSRNDKDYLFIEEALLKLKHNWTPYLDSGLVKDDGSKEYPVKWSEEDLKSFEAAFTEYQKELMNRPFAATQGWVPQDTFEKLLGQGFLEKVDDEYKFKKD